MSKPQSFPLRVDAGDPGLPGCNPEIECGRWATGKLTILPGQELVSYSTISAVGCTQPCDQKPTVSRTDRDAISVHPTMFGQESNPIPAETARAHAELAAKALQLWTS